jgi:twitching motility protein PilT
MPRLDAYLRSLERFGAQAIVLRSGQHVTLRFPAGDRHATQLVPHDQLVMLVREVASPQALALVDSGRAARFEYPSNGITYVLEVAPAPGNWSVVIEPRAAEAAPRRPTGPSEAAAEPPPETSAEMSTRLLIERTAYEQPEQLPRGGSSKALDVLLIAMKQRGASDLHLSTGVRPLIRLHGEMVPLDEAELDGDFLLRELLAIAPPDNREEFKDRNDSDFAYALPGVSRFRVNMFRDRRGPGAVFRAVPFEMPDCKKLGLPDHVLELCNLSKGLVLVTGPTGSGKSTTLASLIDHINTSRSSHIITIEDPIEFLHPNKRSLINQREVGTHTRSFKDALRAALREDPDIVLVGEMRDLETIAIAVETAETGHLVFGTLHTTTAPGTVDRIIDQFPPDRQEQVRTMLAESLQGVISQVLCKKIGGGRVAAYEILLGSSAVSNLIRERKTFQLFSVMQTGRNQGMVTMNDSLIELVRRGQIEPREAYLKAVNKSEMKNLLGRTGVDV